MKKNILVLIGLLIATFAGIKVGLGYLGTHPYYLEILGNSSHWGAVFLGLVGALIPLVIVFFRDRIERKYLFGSLLGGLCFSIISYVTVGDGGPVGLGFFKIIINCAILLGAIILFVSVMLTLGSVIKKKIYGGETVSIPDLLTDFGIGFFVFLAGMYFLSLVNVLFPIVSWLLVVGGVILLIKKKDSLKESGDIIIQALEKTKTHIRSFGRHDLYGKVGIILLCIVLLVGIWYVYTGFNLSYMPYSTAWDANHAYMFHPKMWALHNGFYWNERGMATFPHLYDMFITFWFSLTQWSGGIWGIAPDTFGIVMNFFSGVFVLIIGCSLIKVLVDFVASPEQDTTLVSATGGLLLLTWLTSGMGAFLVFVDNKTDLGVLLFILLGLLLGILFVKEILLQEGNKKKIYGYAVLSGVFFGGAALSKSTAMFDVLNFSVFLWFMFFGFIGSLGIVLASIGLFATMKFRSITDYLGVGIGKILLPVGAVVTGLYTSIQILYCKKKQYFLYISVWILSFLATISVIKLGFLIPFTSVYKTIETPGKFIEKLLFAQEGDQNLDGSLCSLETEMLSSSEDLYINQPKLASGNAYDEDVGRYIGYGWKGGRLDARKANKPYKMPFSMLSDRCYGKGEAKVLCNNRNALDTLAYNDLYELRNDLPSNQSEVYKTISLIMDTIQRPGFDQSTKQKYFSLELRQLRLLMESDTVMVETVGKDQHVYVPNKYLNFFNVTYNWSLQNSSSYYTDIGMIWLVLLMLNVFALVYAILCRKDLLAALSVTTIFTWVVWHLIAGGIVWYNLGMIIWSILTFIVLLYHILYDEREKDTFGLGAWFMGVMVCIILVQLLANMLRIAHHGSRVGKGFLYYKGNAGIEIDLNERLERYRSLNNSYGFQETFDTQWRHYNPLIERANNREDGEGVYIAGTYARYFIENQENVKYDQFLTWIHPEFFDGSACKSYLRLMDKNMQYFAIDPNIATVVQGAANRSLYDRFFGSVNEVTGEIRSYGAITMFTKMIDAGLMRLVSTNNIGAKYAWTLPESSYQNIPEKNRELFKSRMSVSRFMGRNPSSNNFIQLFYDIADDRVDSGWFVDDIADINGWKIDANKMIKIIQSGRLNGEQINIMTQDERKAIERFMIIRGMKEKDPVAYEKDLKQFLGGSIYSPNQIIIVELVK